MMLTFVNFMRAPDPEHHIAPQDNCTKTYLRRTRWQGARILPYVDDFLLFASTKEGVLTLRQRLVNKLIDYLGLLRHPTKDFWTPTQIGHHLGIDIHTTSGYFYALWETLTKVAQHAIHLIGRATRNARWLPVKDLQSLEDQAQYLFLAISVARFFLIELHSVVGEKWGGLVLNTPPTTRLGVVDKGSHSIQRKAYSQARRDCVPTHGKLRLWMGRGTERAPRSSRIFER
jgi:hypothetical protein